MDNVKVFADKQTDRWIGQALYGPNLSMRGYKKNARHAGTNARWAGLVRFSDYLASSLTKTGNLTLSQTKNFRLFQTGRKHCGKRRIFSLQAISSFPKGVFKSIVMQTRKNQG